MVDPDKRSRRAAAARALGAAGEDHAARWYRRRGYRVLDRNWRCPDGELDLVLCRGDVLVVCEVKTRTTERYGTPAEAVTPAKQFRVRRLASRWLTEHRQRYRRLRFDIAGVENRRVSVIEGAF